jgi:TolB-like protein/Flp pilus assembly protein TadD
MDGNVKAPVELAIGHVLFIDIVGYSKLLTSEQRERQQELNRTVRETEQFRTAEAAGKLVRVPTGDGMVLAFFTSPDAPLRCAVAISYALRDMKQLPLRMGIHSGPVDPVEDVNDKPNLAGAGVNIAQRVMSCGDAGHILLSARAADDLAQHAEWKAQLHQIGEAEVKHGIKIGVVNFFDGDVGNSTVPEKIQRLRQVQAAAVRRRTIAWSLGTITVVAAVGAAFWLQSRRGEFATASSGELQKSIAVLPLENLSEDKADAFFADGIQDDVLTSLSKISDLKVISRTSVMQYRGAKRNLRDIGHALGVGNILEGSVRRVGNRVLVNVQLIDAIHDRHLWSERYDRTLTNSIGLQGELATEIAHSLRARLNPEEKGRLASKPTNNPEAYVLYLQAREKERAALFSQEDSIAVDALYDRAVSLDPQFASAMARQSLWNSTMYMSSRSKERKNKAQALAVQALRVAPDLPEAHMALGEWFRMTERNYDAALKEFELVAHTMPNDSEILDRLGYLYRRQGRWREALANFHRVQELDPRIPHDDEAQTAVALRDWKTARVLFRHVLEIAPDDVWVKTNFAEALMNGEGDFAAARAILETIPYPRYDAGGQPILDDLVVRWRLLMLERDYTGAERLLVDFPLEEFPAPAPGLKDFFIGRTAWAKGDQPRARELFEKVRRDWEPLVREHPDDPSWRTRLGVLYAYLGRKEEALRESRRAVELVPENDAIERPAYSTNLALVYALTGESEKAVSLIEQLLTKPSVEVQGVHAMTLTNLRSWKWDVLRSNPRFQEILASPEPKTIY